MGHDLITDPSAFDLEAYLARIGYSGPRQATLEVLRELHVRHPAAIPFENLDPLLRRPVRLQTEPLVRKLVHDGRGGYCFEHNILFAHALDALGFRFRGLAARVLYNAAAGVITSRSHMLLAVDLGDAPVIADVGFGGLTLTAPLALSPGVVQATPHEPFRVTADEGGYRMEARADGDWMSLYPFTLETAYLADYEMTSWYLCHSPASHFISGLMAPRRPAAGRGRPLRAPEQRAHAARPVGTRGTPRADERNVTARRAREGTRVAAAGRSRARCRARSTCRVGRRDLRRRSCDAPGRGRRGRQRGATLTELAHARPAAAQGTGTAGSDRSDHAED